MRIGIGITTFNRPDCLKECLEHIYKHTLIGQFQFHDDKKKDFDEWINRGNKIFSKVNYEVHLYVATDTDEDRRGVAYRKNECLRVLKDCDYVFLFDDDCFPIKDGWIDFFIAGKHHQHLLYLDKKLHRHIIGDFYSDCGGVFMFMTKSVIERVGAFDLQFANYGFEHADYSNRILGKENEYPCKEGTEEYIFAHDYSTPNHKSSITDEEKNIHVKNNWDKYFNNKNKSIYLPL